MLFLTRYIGESIVIGDNVKISILGKKGGQIQIGIEAPKAVSVHRKEIYLQLQADKVARALDEKNGANEDKKSQT